MWMFLAGVVVLYGLMFIYMRLARHYRIVDIPNQRSSHTLPIIRGGGVIFYFAVLLSEILNGFQYPFFLMGLTIIAIISFIDDLKPISPIFKATGHLVAVVLLGLQLGSIGMAWWISMIVLIFGVGVMNAYNFMDGINGITGIYSIVAIFTLMFIEIFLVAFIDQNILILIMSSLIIFGFYNFRKNAICFAGDVGSISMAYIIIFGIILLVLTTGNFSFILLLAVYGVDSILTIIYRLLKKENIFSAHRSHLYQYMVNIWQIDHLKIAVIYGLIQFFINIFIIYNFQFQYLPFYIIAIITLIPLCLAYIYFKYRLERELIIDNA